MFGAISIFLYTSIITLKNNDTFRFVGAFPDNLVYVRLVAATEFGIEAGTLFLIQFWQFLFLGNWMVL
jgi:hypothetical protein